MKNLLVISGPSGSGKSTLIRRLLKKHPEILFSVSHTTREKRQKEQDGRDYYFISPDRFQKMREQDAFAEWAIVHEHFYGTSREEIKSKTADLEQTLVLDIDVQGAAKIRQQFPRAGYVFVLPPSYQALENRILKREHQLDSYFKRRLETAKKEIGEFHLYDFLVINDQLEEACCRLDSIYQALRNARERLEPFVQKLLRSFP